MNQCSEETTFWPSHLINGFFLMILSLCIAPQLFFQGAAIIPIATPKTTYYPWNHIVAVSRVNMPSYARSANRGGGGGDGGVSEFQNDDADDEAVAATIAYFLLPYPIMLLLLLPPKPWSAFPTAPLEFLVGC